MASATRNASASAFAPAAPDTTTSPSRRAGRGRGGGVGRRGGKGTGAGVSGRRCHSGLAALRGAVTRPPRIYISAGEPSGDAHGAAVASALRRRGEVEIEALGGPELEAAGATVLD